MNTTFYQKRKKQTQGQMSTTKYQPNIMTKYVSIYRKIFGNYILFRQFVLTYSWTSLWLHNFCQVYKFYDQK